MKGIKGNMKKSRKKINREQEGKHGMQKGESGKSKMRKIESRKENLNKG